MQDHRTDTVLLPRPPTRSHALPHRYESPFKSLPSRLYEIACVLIFASALYWSLFRTPFIGMANNGDFCRVLGRLSMGPERPVKHPYQMNRDYFVSDYTTAPQWRANAHMFSTVIPMVWLTREIAALVTQSPHYDIRYYGALNAALLITALVLALLYLKDEPAPVRYAIPALLVVIFTDATYISVMNSFYMDAAAIVFLLATVATACLLARNPSSLPWTLALVCAGVLLVASKTQHALIGLPTAGMSLWFALRTRDRRTRALLGAASVLLLATMALMLRVTNSYRATMSYDMVFFKLTRIASNPLQVLSDFGLPVTDAMRIGNFDANTPSNFDKLVPYSVALNYYLSHPRLILKSLDTDLRDNTHPIKPSFANYRQEDGFAPWSEARHFKFWSNLRSRFNRRFPYGLAVLYGGLLPLLCLPSLRHRQLTPVAVFLVIAGCLEFVGSSLSAGEDTIRHLTLFHVITDLLLVLVAAQTLNWLRVWLREHTPVVECH